MVEIGGDEIHSAARVDEEQEGVSYWADIRQKSGENTTSGNNRDQRQRDSPQLHEAATWPAIWGKF